MLTVPEYSYEPDMDDVSGFLSEEDDSFLTSEMRAYMSMKGERTHPTAPLNRLLLDLKENGYLGPENYNTSGNHEWRILETPDTDELGELEGTYGYSTVPPIVFRE